MKATILAAVGAGGAVGAIARYVVAGFLQGPAWTGFPYGIFTVNVSGGFIMGVLTEALALKFHVSPETRAFLTTGIMGGYTTFSTFSLESALLIQRDAYVSAAIYIIGSAVLSIAALYCGLWLVRGIYGH
ncbi:MAG TPA: fluoride efflux transporter CrcB [Rhizomicrobium sp.]